MSNNTDDNQETQETQETQDKVQSSTPTPTVMYFTDANFGGESEWWSNNTFAIDDLNSQYTTEMNNRISSMIVFHGQCQTCNALGNDFRTAPDSSMSYYNANEGVNNQGVFKNLDSSDNNRINSLRTQRDDIYRNTEENFLVLRDNTGYNQAKAITITADNPSVGAFSTHVALAVGSRTSGWYLYDGENYTGNCKEVLVNTGEKDLGIHFFDENFTVRSVSTVRKYGPDVEKPFDPAQITKYRLENEMDRSFTILVQYSGTNENDKDDMWVVEPGHSVEFELEVTPGKTFFRRQPYSGDHMVEVYRISLDGDRKECRLQTPTNDYNHMNSLVFDGIHPDGNWVTYPEYVTLVNYYLDVEYREEAYISDIDGNGPGKFVQSISGNVLINKVCNQ